MFETTNQKSSTNTRTFHPALTKILSQLVSFDVRGAWDLGDTQGSKRFIIENDGIYEIAKNTIRVKQSATEIPSGNLT